MKKLNLTLKELKELRMIDMKSKLNYFAFHLSNPLIIWIRNSNNTKVS